MGFARVVDELDAAALALAAIPPPFSDAIVDASAAASVEAAQAAINAALATLSDDVIPLVTTMLFGAEDGRNAG